MPTFLKRLAALCYLGDIPLHLGIIHVRLMVGGHPVRIFCSWEGGEPEEAWTADCPACGWHSEWATVWVQTMGMSLEISGQDRATRLEAKGCPKCGKRIKIEQVKGSVP